MSGRIADRHPQSYTIGVPQIMFAAAPASGNFATWTDWRALISAFFGITDNAGKVINSKGNVIGTPAEIMDECYLGALDGVNMGGDVETLEHSIANRGYEEVDRIVVLQRPIEYTFNFDEPDIKNLSRYFIGQETNLGLSMSMLEVDGLTFQGSGSQAVTVVDYVLGDPSRAMDVIVGTWRAAGAEGNPTNGTYGFIIGGTNEEDCVGEWENRRQWIAYADFDFDAKTVSAWSYIRPKGTAVENMYGGDRTLSTNHAVHVIPDSNPLINKCNADPSWNVNAKSAWNGFMWVNADEGFYGFSVVGTRRAFKRAAGCAVIVTLTEIGTSIIHVVPKCTLMPEGSMSFSPDAWMQGNFKMSLQNDNSAVMVDRKPALPIPFGYVQTMESTQGM